MGNSDTTETSTVPQKLDYWLSVASFNGFNRLVEAKTKVRIAWFVMIAVAYGCMCFHVSKNIRFYLSYPVISLVEFGSYQVKFPDMTICPIGIPKQYYNFDDKVILGDTLYRMLFEKVKIDRKIYQYHFFNKVNYHREENYTTGHIGSYLFVCSYLGEDCDFRNFTLFRDTVFTDCFTFHPDDHVIPRSGNVLTLGLYTNADLMMYDPDFIAVLHEEDTLPDITTNGFRIKRGGRTEITFKTTHVECYSTPRAPCVKTSKVKYLHTRTHGVYNYVNQDCFRQAIQKQLLEKLNCVDPLTAVMEEYKNAQNCLHIPKNLTSDAIRYAILSARIQYDRRFGTKTFTEANTKELMIGLSRNGRNEFYEALLHMLKQFIKYTDIIKNMTSSYQDITRKCITPCKSTKIDAWSAYAGFTAEDVDNIIEFQLPNADSHDKLITKNSLSLKNLKNNISKSMMVYLRKLDAVKPQFMHQKKFAEEKENVTKHFAKHMAFLHINVVNVPGDGMVEKRAYHEFNLLSDLGGNIGLWVGFSVISIFEVLELFVLLLEGVRRKNRAESQRNSELKNDDQDTGSVPLVVETSVA